MRKDIEAELLKSGYKQKGDWFEDGDFHIKLNKKSITCASGRGVTLFKKENPDTITVERLCLLIETAL